jgi:signal-transduction protein with cAMP-binding, CBS, and nucleotidyltransferase domain
MAIEQSTALNCLLPDQIENLISSIKVKTYNQGTVVVQAGTKTSSGLWIVVNGELDAVE